MTVSARKTLRNRSLHHKTTKKSSGISPVISTIIISGTLLIILVIASFVSANVLELQVASTEFEQAKTNMMLLDEVIEDVSLRRGSGGYVQFNQRSGGIGITDDVKTIKILGPSRRTNVTNSPAATTPTSGGWTNVTGAYGDGSGFAYTSTDSAKQSYGGYGFTIPAGSNITKVRVRLDAWTEGNEKIKLYVSTDGNLSWLATTWTSDTLPTTETTYWVDVTTWTNWTLAKINDNKIWTRVEHVVSGGSSQTNLDWIPVEVTYDPPLSTIYESPPLVSLVYRGGSKASGADMTLRGNNSLNVSMTNALSYLRVETGNGVQIKLDYNRVRMVETGTLVVGSTLHNFIEITFLRLVRGNTGGSGTVNVKAQNIDVDTSCTIYDGGDITIQVQLGPNNTSCTFNSDAAKTVVMFTEILVQVSTA